MNMFDAKHLEQVREPVATARGLPNAFYADTEVFEAEKQAVFAANWACIGFASDVPNPGDVKPMEFLGQPYVIVRGQDGVVRVFENGSLLPTPFIRPSTPATGWPAGAARRIRRCRRPRAARCGCPTRPPAGCRARRRSTSAPSWRSRR